MSSGQKVSISGKSGFQQHLLNFVFILSLISVHLEGSYLAFARIGWTVQAILYVLDLRYALYACFFHTAFFNPAGFFSNSLFTVKHLHIAVGMTAIVRLLKGELKQDLIRAWPFLKRFSLVFIVVALGTLNFVRLGTDFKAVLIPANISLVLGMMIYIAAVFTSYESLHRLKHLEQALKFFLFGVLLQTAASLMPSFAFMPLWKTEILHNNHLGILVSLGLWYALYFFGQPSRKMSHVVSTGTVVFLFAVLLGTCSRTAWISFLLVVPFWVSEAKKSGACSRGLSLAPVLAIILVIVTLILCASNEFIRARVIKMPEILDLAYWQYTLQDRQNFGFLGVFRLRDLHELKDILLIKPLTGAGFIPKVVDIHGFYFLLLGGTGIFGFIAFAAFLYRLSIGLKKSTAVRTPGRESTLAAVSLCAVLTWSFSLIMESYFLQFFVWLPVITGMIYIETANQEGASLRAKATEIKKSCGDPQGAIHDIA